MDRDTLAALHEHLKRFITLSEGPRLARLLPPTYKSEGCDDTLKHTVEWLKARGRNVEADVAWLNERGGECDCKVITNVIWFLDAEI